MNLFGGIGLVAALKRYKTAKSNYDQAVKDVEAKKEALLNTIEQQQYSNYEKEADRYGALEYYNRNVENVLVTAPVEYVEVTPYMMIGWEKLGKYYRVKPIIRIYNGGVNVLHIVGSQIYVDNLGSVMKFTFAGTDVQNEPVAAAIMPKELVLHPGEYIDMVLPTGKPIGSLKSGANGDISIVPLVSDIIMDMASQIIEYYLGGMYPKTHAMGMAVTQFKEDYDCGIAKIPMDAVMKGRMTADTAFYYYTTDASGNDPYNTGDADQNIKLAVYKDTPGEIIWKGQKKYSEMYFGSRDDLNKILKVNRR